MTAMAGICRNEHMHIRAKKVSTPLLRGVVMLSIDTEGMWGHHDYLTEDQFLRRYPNAASVPDRLLGCLCSAELSATWAVVGGLALSGSSGPRDPRMDGLPASWLERIPAGVEHTASVWYRRSLIERIGRAKPAQDVGLHGGLTHMIWTDRRATVEVLRRELDGGIRALGELGIKPASFVFPRNQEAHLAVLAAKGIRCFRGRAPDLSARLGSNLAGAALRALVELGEFTPPPVRPCEVLPGLWNIPASLFLYPMSKARARLVPLKTRIIRVRRGIQAAVRERGIFHLWFHPTNLAESSEAAGVFETIVEEIAGWRDAGEVDVFNMAQMTDYMETFV